MSTIINELRQEILDILSYIEATIDFPEDEVDEIAFNQLSKMIMESRDKASKIYEGSKTGKIIREGLSTVIEIGRAHV